MGGLVGFLLGYYVGAKDGPERLEQLVQSAKDILSSTEFQSLQASLMALAQQTLGQVQQSAQPNGDAMNAGAAWKVISESPEFRGLLATGASLLQGVLTTVTPQARGNGHAPL